MPSKHSSKLTCPRKVQVLRINADASTCKLTTVDTLMHRNGDSDTVADEKSGLETSLGHIPNLKRFEGTTNLDHLCLFNRDLSLGSTCKEGRGKYYIYKCITETPSKLPENKSFGTLGKGRNYGDAFVFKVEYVRDFDGMPMALFDSMEGFYRNLQRGGSAVKTLEAMAEW